MIRLKKIYLREHKSFRRRPRSAKTTLSSTSPPAKHPLLSQLFAFVGTFCDFSGTFYTKEKIMCHMSHVTFNLSLTPTATDLTLLNPPLFIVNWFQIKKKPN